MKDIFCLSQSECIPEVSGRLSWYMDYHVSSFDFHEGVLSKLINVTDYVSILHNAANTSRDDVYGRNPLKCQISRDSLRDEQLRIECSPLS